MTQENKDKYTFSYSAPTESERRIIENIRSEYEPKTENQSKLEQLKALDNKVKSWPKAVSIALGLLGVLTFGGGISLALAYGELAWGIAVSVVGGIIIGAAYPIYKSIFNAAKKKYGGQILSLSEELLNEEKTKSK